MSPSFCRNLCPSQHAGDFFEAIGIPVLQVYGLTETTAICTMDFPGRTEPGRVGRAIEGVEMRLGDDGEILVRSRAGAIEVHDDGPGIAPDDRAHVFDRFFRSPKARNRPGNGIGLAIVEQVATAHDGTVWVATSDCGGAVVGFSVRPDTDAVDVESAALVAGR